MAKPLLTVSYLGTVIGKRRTDRDYTWAVIATHFREAEWRVAQERYIARRVAVWRESFDSLPEEASPDYKYASIYSDADRAAKLATHAAGWDAYRDACMARERAHEATGLVKLRLPSVISYHSRRDLAEKAAGGLTGFHTYRVIPVGLAKPK